MNPLVSLVRYAPLRGVVLALAAIAAAITLALLLGASLVTRASAAGAPTVSTIAPAIGVFGGGTAVTITGTGFVAGATVTFDGVPAVGIAVASATSITATTPAGTPGKPVIVVTNPDGQGATLTAAFTFLGNPPILTNVAPATGSTNGGDTLTLTGTDLAAGIAVTVAGVAATNVVVQSATQVTARTPAGTAAGAIDVVVTNTDTQTSTLVGSFTYITASPPTVTTLSPTSGTHAGTTAITITGTGFASGATVKFGATAATNVAFVSATSLTATVPAGAAGTSVAMTVTNPDSQSGVLANGYAYINTPAPTLTAVSPARAPLAGAVAVTITGTNFVAGATVKFGATAATVTALTATSITATVPAGTSSVSVTVTNPDNDAATLAAAFKYVAAPTVKSVAPGKVSKEGGSTLTISGTGFETGITVTVGGVAATGVKFVSASQITAVAPAGSAASQTVVVNNTDLQTGTLAAAVTYVTPPSVTAISPVYGSAEGGTEVTITGANLSDGVTVKFGEAKATGVTYVSATKVTAVSPAGKDGSVTVTVADKDGLTTASTVTFTYGATVTPTPSPGDKPRFTLGSVPKQGIGLLIFSGGLNDDLIAAATEAGCERLVQAFFVAVNGKFIVFLPAAPAIVNAAWNAHFGGNLPADVALAMRCS